MTADTAQGLTSQNVSLLLCDTMYVPSKIYISFRFRCFFLFFVGGETWSHTVVVKASLALLCGLWQPQIFSSPRSEPPCLASVSILK